MTHAGDEHRAVGGAFTDGVLGVSPGDWDNPSPWAGWSARDVVRHLLGWLPRFLRAGTGMELPEGPSVDEDPVTAWMVHRDGVQALLDDPATRGRVLPNAHVGDVRIDQVADQIYTTDVFCTPGTWPEPRDKTTDRIRTGAPRSSTACSRWTRCSGRAGTTVHGSRSAGTRTRRPA